jgi:putative CocE/NonD family hydrolase
MTLASRFMGQALKLPPATSRTIDVDRDLRVPMPDGAVLLADRYAPRTRPWPLRPPPPLVLVRSPYGRRRSWGLLFGRLLAERGCQAVIQSCRGTFGSGGTFDPFGPDEHDDGLATVAWLRKQPWYPGSFGTCGPSYLGMTQWAIAADAGADLGAIAAQVTTADFRAAFYPGGSFSLDTAMGWMCQVAGQERPLATLRNQLAERGRRPLLNHLPLRDLDLLATGHAVPYWQEWLAHDAPGDEYWKGRIFAATRGEVTAPVSMVGGWHDLFLPLQLRDYAALRAAGRDPYLLIGPWRHADEQAARAWVADTLTWMRAHLAGDRSALRPQPVRIFVTGADEWRDLAAWPPETRPHRWHLHPDGVLAQDAPPQADPDRYTYDPADPTPNLAGPTGLSGRARVDNRADLHQSPARRGPGTGRGGGGRPVRLLQPGAHGLLRPAVRRRPVGQVGEHLRRAAPADAGTAGAGARRLDPRQVHALAGRAPLRTGPPAAAPGLQRRPPQVRPQPGHR